MPEQYYSRRDLLGAVGLGALALSLPSWALSRRRDNEISVYVGTYTSGRSQGIYVYRLDLRSGELKFLTATKGVVNPSFVAIDPRGSHLYAVNEVNKFGGKSSGAVSAFRIDPRTGALRFLNQQSSSGPGPCHLALDNSSKFLFVANYNGGSISVLPVTDAGLGEPIDAIQHHGGSVNPERQKEPHAHGVTLDKANRFLFVPDLGLDKIMIYRFDRSRGKLTPNEVPWAELKPGAGPRHFAFHRNGRWGYAINELNSTFTAFAYDGKTGKLTEVQTVSTLPAEFSDESFCAELTVSPSGKYLYGSNRGHDSIVVFSIDQATGRLNYVQHVSTQGKSPRSFAIDPTGTFLLAANQRSDNIVSFRMDSASGKLAATGHSVELPTPVCLVMSDKL